MNKIFNNDSSYSPNVKEKYKPCVYDPVRDVSPVIPTDVIDVGEAFANGMIPPDVVAPDAEYDNSDEPSKIWKRPSNEFEAIHMLESINAYKRESSANDKAEGSDNQ